MVRRRHPAAADDFEEWTSGGPLSEPLSTPRGVSSMNRETEAVEKGKESELQGTGTVKLRTRDRHVPDHITREPRTGAVIFTFCRQNPLSRSLVCKHHDALS